PSIRIRVPENKTYTFNDIVRGNISFESSDFGAWVIVKKNGIPTYSFAVVIDDYLMNITHVLRGAEHVSNTASQMVEYDALGWQAPQAGRITFNVNGARQQLSRRDQHLLLFIEQYRNLGYLPAALFNFLTVLGWAPVGEEDIFDQETLSDIFN